MRLFSRMFSVSIFLCAFFFVPAVSFAEPEDVDVGTGYRNIMEQGLIFANICSRPAPENGGVDDCQCRAQGICSLAEVTQVAVNIIILILGISGTVALLMFIYGGWNWVFAQGRSEFIQAGKDTMKHAIIGLAIIFGAYALINFVIAILGGIAPGATLEDTIEALPSENNGELEVIPAGSIIDTNNQ